MIKRCYDCSAVIERHELFSLPSFNDKILNFRFGSCAIILSRKYAYIIISLFVIIYFVVKTNAPPTTDIIEESKFASRTWEQYLQDCGKEIYISNGVKAKSNYMKYYQEKVVSWEGVYMYSKESSKLSKGSKYGVYVKMIPTDAMDDIPDIVLAVQDRELKNYKDIIYSLQNGDVVSFRAQIEHMGDEFSYHSAVLESISKTGRTVDVQEIINKQEAASP